MMGLSGVVAGRSSRPTDAVASTSPDAAPTGSPTTLRSARGSVPATRRARPRVRRHSWPSASTTRSGCVSTRPAGSAGSGPGVGSGSRDVLDQRGGHPDQPDAVGERVVELQHQRGPAAGEAPDDVQLPQRPRAIEALHGDRLGAVEHRAHAAAGRRVEPAHVELAIEVRIDLPAWRRDRVRVRDHPLPQAGNLPRGALDLVLQPIAVGRGIEPPDDGDRRAQQRILLDVPHERIAVAHAPLEPDGVGHGRDATGHARRYASRQPRRVVRRGSGLTLARSARYPCAP